MVPLFKSHFSVGKSILTLAEPEKQKPDGPDSIISIAIENRLKEIYLVEDSLTGFLTAFKSCKAHDIHLKFGLRISVCNSYDSAETSSHKVVLFALNDNGFKDLNKIYTHAFVHHEGTISNDDIVAKLTENVLVAIPFYDSYIWNNMYSFSDCMPSFNAHIYFVEDNNLPFDKLTADFIRSKQNKSSIVEAKSIYYYKRDDFDAWITYKIACNRRMGKSQTLSAPEINGCGSREFCFESWAQRSYE